MPAATVRLAPSGPAHTSDLQAALAEVDRHLGPGVATTPDSPTPVAAIPTGSLALDLALGVGGIPKAGSPRSTAPKVPARPPSP
jgi:hypothetical protein